MVSRFCIEVKTKHYTDLTAITCRISEGLGIFRVLAFLHLVGGLVFKEFQLLQDVLARRA